MSKVLRLGILLSLVATTSALGIWFVEYIRDLSSFFGTIICETSALNILDLS